MTIIKEFSKLRLAWDVIFNFDKISIWHNYQWTAGDKPYPREDIKLKDCYITHCQFTHDDV